MENNLNSTPSANRIHISLFGRVNCGKSSLMNAITGQNAAIVSDVRGTTTDPVHKAMELLPAGAVVITDTPGLDDQSEIGQLRINKTNEIISKTDLALIIADASSGLTDFERKFASELDKRKIPYITVYNKCDLTGNRSCGDAEIYVSAMQNININELKEKISSFIQKYCRIDKPIIADRLKSGDTIILVTPIDSSAPKGRMILPQVQTIRDILNINGICIVVQPSELETALQNLKKPPYAVITDSQVFGMVKNIVPDDIFLTSFSIIFAQYKGILKSCTMGACMLEKLSDGDTILISEGCSHHRQCEDIGTVRLPAWIKKYTGKSLNFKFSSGSDFPSDLSEYNLIVHCGGCMLNEREIISRLNLAAGQSVPFTNYGVIIAYINGILERSLRIFPEIHKLLE